MQLLDIITNSNTLKIEGVITIAALFLQSYFFLVTRRKINIYRNLLPDIHTTYSIDHSATDNPVIRVNGSKSNTFEDIIIKTNQYLENNKGVADFEITCGFVKREIELHEDSILSQINVPMYIGLMGTFIGILLGLIDIIIQQDITKGTVITLLFGVMVAMLASFTGLIFTVYNNAGHYKKAKEVLERSKGRYYDFLKLELLSWSGNGLQEAVNRFTANITEFNQKFGKALNNFDSRLTDRMEAFTGSVNLLSKHGIDLIQNTEATRDFLNALKTEEMLALSQSNQQLALQLSKSGEKLNEFVKNQGHLNQAIGNTVAMVQSIESILDRIRTFESSLNNLGDRLDLSSYWAKDVLDKIKKKMDDLDKQYELIRQHSQNTSGQIEKHFIEEKQKIAAYSEKFFSALQESMNLSTTTNPLANLELLQSIDTNLVQISKTWDEKLKQITVDLALTKAYIGKINDQVTEAVIGQGNAFTKDPDSSKNKSKASLRNLWGLLRKK